MAVLKVTPFIAGLIFLLSGAITSADTIVFARDQHTGTAPINTLITAHSEKHSSRFLKKFHQYELYWSGITEGDSITLCFPVPWSVSRMETVLFSDPENPATGQDKHCKRLQFPETSGSIQLLPAATDQQLRQCTLHHPDFNGVIALEPEPVEEPDFFQFASYGFHKIPVQLPENQTDGAPFATDSDSASGQTGVPASGSGSYGLYPFDQKRPRGLPFPGPGSSMVLSLVLPGKLTPASADSRCIRIEILFENTSETRVLTLVHDEVQALQEAGILTKPLALLRYLQERSHKVRHWLTQRDDLEEVLDTVTDDTNTNVHEAYINNLIASLNELSITLSPDSSPGESLSVPGILGAMTGGEGVSQPDSSMGKDQQGQSTHGLRRRKAGPEQHERPSDLSSDDQGDQQQPYQQSANTGAGETGSLDIRGILNLCHFSAYFSSQPDRILGGLYSYGQLTIEQLHQLLSYNPAAKDYNLSALITSSDLITVLEQGDNLARAKSLSVIRSLDQQQGEIYHGVLSYAPKEWHEVIQRTPDNVPESADGSEHQLSRLFARMFLPHTALSSLHLLNRLARSGFILSRHLNHPTAGTYPLALLIIQHYDSSSETYGEITLKLNSMVTDLTIPPALRELIGFPESESEEADTMSEQGPIYTEPAPLEEKISIIKTFLLEKEVTQETIDVIERFNMLTEHRVSQIFVDDVVEEEPLYELLQEAQQLLSDQECAPLALKQLGYSEEAIKLLSQRYLDQQTCALFARAFDERATLVASQLTIKLRLFNSFLSMNRIKHPPLNDKLKTHDDWRASDAEKAALEQAREQITQKGLEHFADVLAEDLATRNFRAGHREIRWDNLLDMDIDQVTSKKQNVHDQHFELLTGQNHQLTLATALKEVTKQKAREHLKQKIKRQQRIDNGEEGWCEWIMRILFE